MVDLPPTEDIKDKTIDIIATALENLPYGIGTVASFAQVFFTPPFQKRLNNWFIHLRDAVTKLEEDSITKEKILNNDEIMDIIIQATSIASKTMQKDKISALKNSIINCVNPMAPKFSLQQIFLCYIETFSIDHLNLLHFLINPRDWFIKHGQEIPRTGLGGIVTIRDAIIKAYSELKHEKDLVNSIWTDLLSKGLLEGDIHMLDKPPRLPSNTNALNMLLSPRDVLACQATSLGVQFVTFISE